MEEAAGQKAYEISNVARVLQLNLWQGDKEKSPVPNFRMQPMAEGLVILSPEKDIFSPVEDRDLINEAVNGLFDFKADNKQLKWFPGCQIRLVCSLEPFFPAGTGNKLGTQCGASQRQRERS